MRQLSIVPCKLTHHTRKCRLSTSNTIAARYNPNGINREKLVGITQFATKDYGISGVVKHRFSDFQVREITPDGTVVYLKDLDGSKLQGKYYSDTLGTSFSDPKECSDLILQDVQKLSNRCNILCDIADFVADVYKNSKSKASIRAFHCNDKQVRSQIHESIRTRSNGKISSQVEVVNGANYIVLSANKSLSSENLPWPEGLGRHLEFTLLKENVDTIQAIALIAQMLRIPASCFGYAGVKDKRGVTAQKCTVFRKMPTQLNVLSKLANPFIRIGDFRFRENPIALGDLRGNSFSIVLRNVRGSDDEIIASCKELQQVGFINYYGLQRFGKGLSSTHFVGKHLLKADYHGAIKAILAANGDDRHADYEARVLFARGKLHESYDKFRKSQRLERSIVKALIDRTADYVFAVDRLPKTAKLLYVNAYHSYIWNRVVSKRLETFGFKVLEGDIVSLGKLEEECQVMEESGEFDDHIDVDGSGNGNDNGNGNDDNNIFQEINIQRRKYADKLNLYIVTRKDIESNRFTIYDIILPLPGSNVTLPENETAYLYEKYLKEDGLTMADFSNCNIQYRFKGVYRKLMERPKDFSWKVLRYGHLDQDIMESEINQFRKPAMVDMEVTNNTGHVDDKYKALQLSFTLGSGSYATMLLREVTKCSSDSENQMGLFQNNSN